MMDIWCQVVLVEYSDMKSQNIASYISQNIASYISIS